MSDDSTIWIYSQAMRSGGPGNCVLEKSAFVLLEETKTIITNTCDGRKPVSILEDASEVPG